MSNDDLDLFRSQMDDVKPIKAEVKVRLRPSDVDKGVLRARREAAEAVDDSVSGPLSVSHVQPVESQATLSFMRSGIQHSLFKKIKQGVMPIEARVDLHGMTVEQARSIVLEFIRDCCSHDVRFALITHGKGEGRAQPAILKSCISSWLPELSEVLAFHSAHSRHGGTGATYVLIRSNK